MRLILGRGRAGAVRWRVRFESKEEESWIKNLLIPEDTRVTVGFEGG
jgi:hypothetical protein